jgi:uncharacterized protein YfaS (alpha-2-macroglobulin family)
LRLELEADATDHLGRKHVHEVRVDEYRRPAFEVAVEGPTSGVIQGDPLVFHSTARYYGGGPLQDAAVDWSVFASPKWRWDDRWPGYQFSRQGDWRVCPRGYPSARERHRGQSDAQGRHSLAIATNSVGIGEPITLQALARVGDDRSRANAVMAMPAVRILLSV